MMPRGSAALCSRPQPHSCQEVRCVFSCSVLLVSFSLPQIGTQNSLEILDDPKAEVVDEIAAKLGLRKVRTLGDFVCLCVAMEKVAGSSLQLRGVIQDRRGASEMRR